MKTRILITGTVLIASACAFGQTPEPSYHFPSVFQPNQSADINRTGCMTVFTPLGMGGSITFSRAGSTFPLSGWGCAGGGGNWQGVGQGYAQFQGGPPTAWKFWPALGDTPGSISIDVYRNGPIIETKGAFYDPRTDEERANAPKISIGVPLSDLGYVKSLQVGNDRAVILAAGLASDPGYPINPNGLELQYDENGVRKSVAIHVGLDGRFSGFAMADLGVNGTGGRALLIYHRTSGDDVNVGYYGDSAMFERRKEIKSLGRDSLRNIINEAVKNTGHFRWRSNGVVMGVRG